MTSEPLTKFGFTSLVDQLKLWTRELLSVIEGEYPPGAVYDDQQWPAGSGWDGSTGVIRRRIDEVIEAFSMLQEALGLPPGELSMRAQAKADREAARAAPWPTAGSVKAEMLGVLACMAHDDKARPRDRRGAIQAILDAIHQDRSEALLEAIRESYRRMEPRVAVLERRAAEWKGLEVADNRPG